MRPKRCIADSTAAPTARSSRTSATTGRQAPPAFSTSARSDSSSAGVPIS